MDSTTAATRLTDESGEAVFGGLRILSRGPRRPSTLLVMVHGWRGSDSGTWGRTPELLLERFPLSFDVGLFSSKSGLWPLGRRGAEDLAAQLVEDVKSAAEEYGYLQVGIAGHSLGGLVAALAAAELLEEAGEPVVTGLLCVGTPWDGVRAAGLVSWLNAQLRDLAARSEAGAKAGEAYERVSKLAWVGTGRGRDDPLDSPLQGAGGRQYWTYLSHRGACAAGGPDDRRLIPFVDFAEAASRASTVLYLRALWADLENWRIRPISRASADELYERQSASPWRATADDDSEEVPDRERVPKRRRGAERGAAAERVDDILELAERATDPVCLTGEGGAGKTTAITELARQATLSALETPHSALVPVVLRLNDEPVGPPEARSAPAILGALTSRCQAGEELGVWCEGQASDDFLARMLLLVDGLDEADAGQVDLVCELARQVARARGKVVLAGRPEAVIRERRFQVMRLDALDSDRIDSIVRRQLHADAEPFWGWILPGTRAFLTNPGQLDMIMRLWQGGGHDEDPPSTLGELYDRVLAYYLARPRDPRQPPLVRLGPEWFDLAERVKGSLAGPAFDQLGPVADAPVSHEIDPRELGLAGKDCAALQAAGILEQRERGDGRMAWRFASARWREFFASLELRRRAEAGEPLGGLARPTWLNVWRMAAAFECDALLEAAGSLSPILRIVVGVSAGERVPALLAAAMWGRQRRLLVDMLRDTPGHAATATLVELCGDGDSDVREAAAGALDGTTDPTALAVLLELCRDADSDVREAAAEALGGTTDATAVAALLELCRDGDSEVREAAAWALEGTTEPTAVAALLELCRDGDSEVREAAAWALDGATDPAALGVLVELGRDEHGDVRRAAAEALKGTTDPTALAMLVELCREADDGVRWVAAWALGGTTDPTALAGLAELCREPDGGVRRAAALGLWGTTDPTALAALVELCRDADGRVRSAAAGALKGTTDATAVARLVELCRDADEGLRWDAVGALEGTTDATAVARLVELCRDADEEVRLRRAAAWTLKGTTDPTVLAVLLELCRDADGRLRSAAAGALEGTTDPRAPAALVELCRDQDFDLRWAAARALKGTTDPTALAALVELSRDANLGVRWAAILTLEGLPSGAGVGQRLLVSPHREVELDEAGRLLFARLIPDDVPFAEWPEG